MTDTVIERKIQAALAARAYGTVLVSGYGLGIVQKLMCANPNVDSILTIEVEPGVVTACKEEYGEIHGEVEYSDFFRYESKKKYDCIIGDIWEEIDLQCLPIYTKFKDKAGTLLNDDGTLLAWGGDYFEYLLADKDKSQLIDDLSAALCDAKSRLLKATESSRRLTTRIEKLEKSK